MNIYQLSVTFFEPAGGVVQVEAATEEEAIQRTVNILEGEGAREVTIENCELIRNAEEQKSFLNSLN